MTGSNQSLKKLEQQIFEKTTAIGVVGLGYVGLPLACLLATKFRVIGFDINKERVEELKSGHDRTREIRDSKRLKQATLEFNSKADVLKDCSVIIVTVPTPVDGFKKPDLGPVESACRLIGKNMSAGTVVVFESTVYPGVTENICAPILSAESKLTANRDFFLGYSPERVNPGDEERTIDRIVKVVSGSTPEVRAMLARIYGSVITAGIHEAANIATAEAAKVIENTQRDLNIALINELAMIFHQVGLDTNDVLSAAQTKWNFLKFKPGLVGGHCIGVDPYYLTYMAEGLGFHPQVILAGRRINDGMGDYVADQTIRMILQSGKTINQALRVVVMGVTFKENVPDVRNTKVVQLMTKLESYGAQIFAVDPVADKNDFKHEYGRTLSEWNQIPPCDAAIYAVPHQIFSEEYPVKRIAEKLAEAKVVVDIKGVIDREEANAHRLNLWRL